MVLYLDEEFKPFLHCKFKETIVRLLLVPSLRGGYLLVAVSKFGTVGLYESSSLKLIHLYFLDWSQSIEYKPSNIQAHATSRRTQIHIVVDAIFANDLKMLIFATTRGQLQCYDIGEIETYSLGLEILPRKEFNGLKAGVSPCRIRNEGHIETHRISGLESIPSCITYLQGGTHSSSRILIGDFDGGVTIISVKNPKTPFLNHRKIRGVIHQIKIKDLERNKVLHYYKGHNETVKDLVVLEERQTVVTCSRDKKYSVVSKDLTGISESTVSSLPVGATCLAHSDSLKILVAGCDDGMLRVFSYLSLGQLKLAIEAHKCSLVGLLVLHHVSDDPVLVSYAEDVEIRAWNLRTFSCLQNQFLKFPRNLPIVCKTPEFGRKSLVLNSSYERDALTSFKMPNKSFSKESDTFKNCIIVLYSNCYAKIDIGRDDSSQLNMLSILYEELHLESTKKGRLKVNKDPKSRLTDKDEEDIACRSKHITDTLLNLKHEFDEKTDRLSELASEQINRWGPRASSRSDQPADKRHGIYHKIPFYKIDDPKCSLNYSSVFDAEHK